MACGPTNKEEAWVSKGIAIAFWYGFRVRKLFTGYRKYGDRDVRWLDGDFVVIPVELHCSRWLESISITLFCLVTDGVGWSSIHTTTATDPLMGAL